MPGFLSDADEDSSERQPLSRKGSQMMNSISRPFSVKAMLLSVLLILTSGSMHEASACSCVGSSSPCEAFGMSDAVFIGTAIEGTERKEEKAEDGKLRVLLGGKVRFTVEQAFVGINTTEVNVITWNGAACGFGDFTKGEKYLLYLWGNYWQGFSASMCSRSTHISHAADDLAFLATLTSKSSGVWLYGAVGIFRDDYSKNETVLTSGVAGITITASTSNGQSFKTVTNEEGRYEFTSLQPGVEYTVKAELPDYLQKQKTPRTVRINNGGCARIDFYAVYNGVISGQVLNFDDTPATGLRIYLFRADNKKQLVALTTVDMHGNYQLAGIAPGVYVAELQIKSASLTLKRRQAALPTPAPLINDPLSIWYPNAANRQSAEVIEMKPGQKLTGYNFKLQPQYSLRTVEAVVLWPDGSPAFGADFSCTSFDPQSQSYGETYQRTADEKGRFSISGFIGSQYLITARSFHLQDRAWRFAEPLQITFGADGFNAIKLILKWDEDTYKTFKPKPPRP